jgi:hypothetical protein
VIEPCTLFRLVDECSTDFGVGATVCIAIKKQPKCSWRRSRQCQLPVVSITTIRFTQHLSTATEDTRARLRHVVQTQPCFHLSSAWLPNALRHRCHRSLHYFAQKLRQSSCSDQRRHKDFGASYFAYGHSRWLSILGRCDLQSCRCLDLVPSRVYRVLGRCGGHFCEHYSRFCKYR